MSAYSHLTQQCIISIEHNITIRIEQEIDEIDFPDFVGNLCPDDCSGNGTCSDSEFFNISIIILFQCSVFSSPGL
jgi:hypothetical protein